VRWAMRMWALALVAALVAAGVGTADPKSKDAENATCGEYGTTVHFEKTPTLAAKRALKEEKLVFVLHVSGHFENSEFT
jgi:hypothetical protein